MLKIIDNISIKYKIAIISFFAIIYLIAFSIQNIYFSKNIKNNFIQMNKMSFFLKILLKVFLMIFQI
jgi:hypothetical protein